MTVLVFRDIKQEHREDSREIELAAKQKKEEEEISDDHTQGGGEKEPGRKLARKKKTKKKYLNDGWIYQDLRTYVYIRRSSKELNQTLAISLSSTLFKGQF